MCYSLVMHLLPAPKTEFVYRLEDADGVGAYRGGHAPSSWSGQRRPSPHVDFSVFAGADPLGQDYDIGSFGAMNSLLKDYLFAFPSLDAAAIWFDSEDFATMRDRGCTLRIVPAAEVLISDSGRQCIFRPAGRGAVLDLTGDPRFGYNERV